MTPLEIAAAKLTVSFERCFGRMPDILNDGNRLVVEQTWALAPKGSGWRLIRKYQVPEQLRQMMERPAEYEYVPIWKDARPLEFLVETLLIQYAEIKIKAVLAEVF